MKNQTEVELVLAKLEGNLIACPNFGGDEWCSTELSNRFFKRKLETGDGRILNPCTLHLEAVLTNGMWTEIK